MIPFLIKLYSIALHSTAPHSNQGKSNRAPRLDLRKKSISLDSPDMMPLDHTIRENGIIYENLPIG